MNRVIKLNTKSTTYILPWDFTTVLNAISSQNLSASELLFTNECDKHVLSKDLFLLAAKGSIKSESDQVSLLARIARDLMN